MVSVNTADSINHANRSCWKHHFKSEYQTRGNNYTLLLTERLLKMTLSKIQFFSIKINLDQ